ncbi:MAG: hypothetical protein WC373_10505, partial [Smithella sp.]
IIDEAAERYKHEENRSYAQMLAWSTGKRGKTNDNNSIVATYLLHVHVGYSKNDAVRNVARLFGCQSPGAVIDVLKREKKKCPTIPLPNNWPKY